MNAAAALTARENDMRDGRTVEVDGKVIGYTVENISGLFDAITVDGTVLRLNYRNRGAAAMFLKREAAKTPAPTAPAKMVYLDSYGKPVDYDMDSKWARHGR